MRDRKRCAGFSDRRNRRKNAAAHPDGAIPPGQTRTRPFRKLSCRRSAANSTSGSGPTGNPERLPRSVLNSPEPASGLAFGKAASRPVKPARGSASSFTPPPHHLTGFRKCSLRRKSAPPKTSISAGRENADKAGRLTAASPSSPGELSVEPDPANKEPKAEKRGGLASVGSPEPAAKHENFVAWVAPATARLLRSPGQSGG